MKTIVSYLLVIIILTISVGYAEETTQVKEISDPLKVYLTYGPSGPKREPKCFANEKIFVGIELPQSLSVSNNADLLFDLALVSQADKSKHTVITASEPVQYKVLRKIPAPVYAYLFLTPPRDFESGKYDLVVSLYGYIDDIPVLCEGTVAIDIRSSSDYGVRNMTFMHGGTETDWVADPNGSVVKSNASIPGSNVFVPGENGEFRCFVGGLSVGEDNRNAVHIKFSLVSQEGTVVKFGDAESDFIAKTDEVFNFVIRFCVWQPGDFVLKIETENVETQQKDSYELPFIVRFFPEHNDEGKTPGDQTEKEETKPAKEIQEPLNIYLTYGPSGPEREPKCFADETIFIKIGLPQSLSVGNRVNLLLDMAWVSRADRSKRNVLAAKQPFQYDVLRNTPSFSFCGFSLPKDIEEGKYDLEVSVYGYIGDTLVLCNGRVTIDVRSSAHYGIRHLTFLHTAMETDWVPSPDDSVPITGTVVPGSNVFVPAERGAISYTLSGLSRDEDNVVAIHVKYSLLSQEGLVYVEEKSLIGPASADVVHLAEDFVLAQTGDFVLKIETEDLNSQQKDSCELPIFVRLFPE